ncbi:MAG TPA: inorganic phosphate transporter [Frankiaceae bacterium]|nr:inorganic phosphate transporter [Frankiaceae bacterium]
MELAGLVALIAISLAFDFTNGFHDAANAIAVAVSTRALSPRVALILAAAMNLVGALISTSVAATVGKGVIASPSGNAGLVLVFSAVVGAIAWNLITWRLGLPSSSSHALIGGLVGAAIAAGSEVKWAGIGGKVVAPMVISPLTGFALGFLFMLALLWLFRRSNPHVVNRSFHYGQMAAAAAISLGHGLQDAQKTMGVITLSLVATGHLSSFRVPLWVILAAASAIGLGTLSGGWRIMRTLGRRVIKLDNASGFAAQTVSSIVLYVSSHFGLPVSTTHVTTSSIMGVGATRKLSAVRWGVAGNIAAAWVLTLPAAAMVAAAVELGLHSILL